VHHPEHPAAAIRHIVAEVVRRGIQPQRRRRQFTLRVDTDVWKVKAQWSRVSNAYQTVLRAFRMQSAYPDIQADKHRRDIDGALLNHPARRVCVTDGYRRHLDGSHVRQITIYRS